MNGLHLSSPLWYIRQWAGLVVMVTDSTSTCTHRFTRGPPEQTVPVRYFRHIMAACSQLKYHDPWVQAQHAIGVKDTLAQLNCRVHELSQTALQKYRLRTIPLPEILDGCSLGSIDNGTQYDPTATMGVLYSRASSTPMGQRPSHWDATILCLIEPLVDGDSSTFCGDTTPHRGDDKLGLSGQGLHE